ncbi:MAG: MBL fold metallo-hydrolase [Acutalibacteraceae bacterium]
MFEISHLIGNTSYYTAYTNVGIVRTGDGVVLVDACDHIRMAKGLSRQLEEMGLPVKTVIDTHCHVDHICGNRFFREKYGCRLLCTAGEQMFIAEPDLEPKFYYSGIDTDKSKNPFFMVEPSRAEVITPENTPEGFEIIPLPGHSFDMVGVRTPDNVVCLADAVLSRRTWDEYKLPFYHNINASLKTFDAVSDMQAEWFLPSHDKPVREIAELAQYNKKCMLERKELIFSLCPERSFEEIFIHLMAKLELEIRNEKYPMYAIMLRNFLQSLVEDDVIFGRLENNRFVYHVK